jgi:hypothetical protein
MLAGTGLCLLGLHLAYVQLNDTYLVGFLPFVLLVPAGLLRRTGCSRRWLALTAAGCLGLILALSLWMRGTYNRLETEWKAADALLADGIPLRCIGAGKHWTEYHGAWDTWLAETRPDLALWRGRSPVVHEFHGPFYAWLLDWYAAADYQVSGRRQPETPEGWRIVQRHPYRNVFFQQRTIYTFARLDLGQPRPDACARATASARR